MTTRSNPGMGRAIDIIKARLKDPSRAATEEAAFALAMLGDPTILTLDHRLRDSRHHSHSERTPFGATEEFAEHLEDALAKHAERRGTAFMRQTSKYSPLFATPVMFKGLWQTRQMADQLGIPYGFYANTAVDYWFESGRNRMPLPSQLHDTEIAVEVMLSWQARLAAGVDTSSEKESLAIRSSGLSASI